MRMKMKTTTKTTSMKMTDGRNVQPRRQINPGGGLAWKSSLVASSLGAVLLGWALLAQADSAAATASTEQMPTAAPRVIVLQSPGPVPIVSDLPQPLERPARPVQAAPSSSPPRSARPSALLPALPERPIFQQPATRSRAS